MGPHPEALIAAARLQTDQSLGQLLDLYRGYLGFLARTEVGPQLQRKFDPSDLVQETLLDAHRQFSHFQGSTEAQFLAWLRRILAGKTANMVRHYFAAQGRDVRQEIEGQLTASFDRRSLQLSQMAVAGSESPSQHLVQREQAVIVAEALQTLPEDYRQVLLLRHWEDLTFPQIALQMQRTVDSVEKLWLRAVGKLRQTMQRGALS